MKPRIKGIMQYSTSVSRGVKKTVEVGEVKPNNPSTAVKSNDIITKKHIFSCNKIKC